jgi:hypothetical protein
MTDESLAANHNVAADGRKRQTRQTRQINSRFNAQPKLQFVNENDRRQPGTNAGRSSALRCPHCNGAGISRIQKLLLGPVFTCRCTTCGGHWRISWWSVVVALISMAAIPVLLVLSWVNQLLNPGGGSVLAVGILVLTVSGFVVVYAVPVRRR